MNILARILSHGFAIAVVLLLASIFIYRGELFPGMPMPAFLGLERQDTAAPAAADEPETTAATDTADASATAGVQPPPLSETAAGEVTEAAIPAPASAAGAMQPAAPIPAPAAEASVEQPVPEAMAEPVTEAEIPVPVPAETTPAAETATPAVPAGAEPITAMPPPPGMTEPEADVELPVPVPAGSGSAAADETASAVTEGVETSGSEAAAPQAVAEPPEPEATVAVQPGSSLSDTAGEAATPVETAAAESSDEPATPSVPEASDMPAPDMVAAVAPPSSAGTHKPALDMTRPYHVLAAAREAYWMRDHQEAESLYRQLIALDPDNPDGYGELGNLYFTQGKWEEAASAYFEAGSRLARSGHITEAENLLDVIRGLESTRADELADIINQAR